ncbi:5980_t:CDS:2 [Funneliformis mosseae]|uniref:5980_t:CDS:1 n=1 Tax=Funneliformis mosseae TaxID=27381 RepID=A0A9N9H098_FUNMO|nr:5980_t:CDS:2 [Funneliformis mosseae]
MELMSEGLELNEENEGNNEINNTEFSAFLESINEDYQRDGSQIRIALDKFAKRYVSAKSKSIPRLCSFLYDLNRDLDPTAYVKSGSIISVQV